MTNLERAAMIDLDELMSWRKLSFAVDVPVLNSAT